MKKLIKLLDTHYIIVDDSEIKEGDYYLQDNKYIYRGGISESLDITRNKKITHSTQQLVGVITIPLSEVEEVINGYSVEKMIDKLDTPDGLDQYSYDSGVLKGFKAYQELACKLFTEIDMKKYRLQAKIELLTEYSERIGLDAEKEIEKCFQQLKSLLPKTEWDIEFKQDKIKLV